MKSLFYCLLICALLLAFTPDVRSCGPWFPSSFIETNGEPSYPMMSFSDELSLVAEECMPEAKSIPLFMPSSLSVSEADLKDFAECISSPEAARILKTAEARKDLVKKYAKFAEACRAGTTKPFRVQHELRPLVHEFFLYLDGVRQMRDNAPCSDIPAQWEKLLKLPPERRRFKTSWTLYMKGNVYATEGKMKEAHKCYESLRKAVTEGFTDNCGLAFASIRRDFACEKKLQEKLKYGLRAVAYYGRSKKGEADKSHQAVLRTMYYLTGKVLHNASPPRDLFKDTICAEIVLARKFSGICYGSTFSSGELFGLLKQKETVQGARFAHLAYRAGDVETAEKWLDRSPRGSMLALWLRAEIARRNGNYEKATEYYRQWLSIFRDAKNKKLIKEARSVAFPGQHVVDFGLETFESQIYGRLGTTAIHRRDFMEAMHCFMMARSWVDAAYIAESVLDTAEVKGYVDAYKGHERIFFSTDEAYRKRLATKDRYEGGEIDMYGSLRHLLARRMMREKDYANAVKYMPQKLKAKAELLVSFLKKGREASLSGDTRALSLYNAAKLMRWYGVSLTGTELLPDSYVTEGAYEYGIVPGGGLPKELTAKEEVNRPGIPRRFHYRYVAAKMMKEVDELATDKTLKALACYVGGRYLGQRDPKLADPFYKKLVRLHVGALSEVADSSRWFPENYSEELENEVRHSLPLKDLKDVAGIIQTGRKAAE